MRRRTYFGSLSSSLRGIEKSLTVASNHHTSSTVGNFEVFVVQAVSIENTRKVCENVGKHRIHASRIFSTCALRFCTCSKERCVRAFYSRCVAVDFWLLSICFTFAAHLAKQIVAQEGNQVYTVASACAMRADAASLQIRA